MSDLEPAVSFKPNSNEVTITDSSATIINVEALQQTLEEQELQDKIQPIKGSKLYFLTKSNHLSQINRFY